MTKQLDQLRALPLPAPARVVADSLAQAQRELDGLRAAGAAADRIETRRDQMLADAERAIAKHYGQVRESPTVAMRSVVREYKRIPSGREAEQRRASLETLTDDLSLMTSTAVANLAADVVAGRLPDAFTRSAVAAVARECRLRGDSSGADAIGEAFPVDLEPWRCDARWRDAAAGLAKAERLTADSRKLSVTDAKGKVQSFALDDLLV